jgi:hypothetical protein
LAQLVKSGEALPFGISPKMATALTDPVRSRILMELSVRTLSPSQFVERAGGDLSYVSRCFRQLESWGYAEVVEERPGRRQGAAIEHVYRGIQRAYFNTATWKSLPRSRRDAFSRSILDSYFARTAEAIEAGTYDAEADRHHSCDMTVLDRPAWRQLGERLNEVLQLLQELEVASADRLGKTDGERIPTVLGLAAFRSAQSAEIILRTPKERADPPPNDGVFLVRPEIAKALSNRWRSHILAELVDRPMSSSQFSEEFGGDPSYIARCFRELASWGLLDLVETRRGGRRGGGVERIYRNPQCSYFDTPTWESLPPFIRNELNNFYLDQYRKRVSEAIEAGTFDAEPDRHLSWKLAVLDRNAWSALASALGEVFRWLPDLERETTARTDGDLSQLIPTVVGLAQFRSPGAGNPDQGM